MRSIRFWGDIRKRDIFIQKLMALLFTCDNFTWNLAHPTDSSSFLFLDRIWHCLNIWWRPSFFHNQLSESTTSSLIIISFPLSQYLHLSRANPFCSSAVSSTSPTTTPTTLLVKNLTSTIKYHIIILFPLHNTLAKAINNEHIHTQKNKNLMKRYFFMVIT